MCTSKTLQCFIALGERERGERRGGRQGEGKEKASDPEKADGPPFMLLLANKRGVDDKVLEAPSQWCLTLWRRSWIKTGVLEVRCPIQAEALLTCSSQGWAGFHRAPTGFPASHPISSLLVPTPAVCLPMTQRKEELIQTLALVYLTSASDHSGLSLLLAPPSPPSSSSVVP